MSQNRSIDEETHLKEILSTLAANGKNYLACQVVHLAGIVRAQSQPLLPVLRWGYLLAKGHLSEQEAVSLLTALYTEVRSSVSGESGGKLLSLLAQSRDGMWLAERFREEIARQEERRKTNRIPRGEIDERLKEGEGHDEEVDNEGVQKEDDPRVLPRPCR